MMYYPLILIISGLIGSVLKFLFFFNIVNIYVEILSMFLITIQGFMNAIVYTRTQTVLDVIKNDLFKSCFAGSGDEKEKIDKKAEEEEDEYLDEEEKNAVLKDDEDGEDDIRFSSSIFLTMIGYDYKQFETEEDQQNQKEVELEEIK